MNLLAFDLGTTFGWAYGDGIKLISSGSLKLKSEIKFNAFSDFLYEFSESNLIKLLAYEKVMAHKGTIAAHTYGGFQAVLQMFSNKTKIPIVSYSVPTIRKYVTGNGRSSKEHTSKILKCHGYIHKTLDESDAIAVYLLARKELKQNNILRT